MISVYMLCLDTSGDSLDDGGCQYVGSGKTLFVMTPFFVPERTIFPEGFVLLLPLSGRESLAGCSWDFRDPYAGISLTERKVLAKET